MLSVRNKFLLSLRVSTIFMMLAYAIGSTQAVSVAHAAPTTVTYSYTGGLQSFVVPAGVTSLQIVVVGASGGGGPSSVCPSSRISGQGASIATTFAVGLGAPLQTGNTLRVLVGGAGGSRDVRNNCQSGGGGGGSFVWLGTAVPANPLIAAGGGGGGGSGGGPGLNASLTTNGVTGTSAGFDGAGGAGGTGGLGGGAGQFNQGGGGGGGWTGNGGSSGSGGGGFSIGNGGAAGGGVFVAGGYGGGGGGGLRTFSNRQDASGGGGGGFSGGGGGGQGQAGGGGGSYVDPSGTNTTITLSGIPAITNGTVTITYTIPPADAIAPTASPTQAPAANLSGWNNSNVTVTWNWTDNAGGSGLNLLLCPATTVVSGEGASLSAMGTCADIAGNLGSNTVSGMKIDRTAPNTSLTAPTGWNNVDVTLTLMPNDVLSGVGATNFILDGGAPQTGTSIAINTEGIHTIEFWSVDNAGNAETHHSAEVKIDKTPPTISHSQLPVANGNGWNNGDVTVTFVCGDALSGLASCTDPQTVTTEGQLQEVTGTALDNAGNSATDPTTVSIDKSAPTISAAADRAANINGWYNADVMVSFTCNDTLSGIASCPAAQTLGEGTNQSASGTATDAADNNSVSATLSGINVDKTAPTISAAATAPASPNSNSWYNGDVTIHFTCTDSGGSGIPAGACPADETLSAEGVAITSSTLTVTDAAGNTSDASNIVTVQIDKTLPTVSLVDGPADSGSYYFGSVPAAPTCWASDALSGLDGSCTVSGYSALVGPQTVSAAAQDMASNQNTASVAYTVLAWTTNGFFQPVDMGGVWNTVKNGSTVPLKFEVFADSTELTSTSIVNQPLTATQTLCTGGAIDDIELLASGATSLRYDTTAGQYIYNWQTPKKAGYCYVVTVKLADGSTISANFKLK